MIKQAIFMIGLWGSTVYLATLSAIMLMVWQQGSALWQADWALQHGEPFLVIGFTAASAYATYQSFKGLRSTSASVSSRLLRQETRSESS